MSTMEYEGMKNGCFNMAKEDGISACRAYRTNLEKQGYVTSLVWFANDLFIVEAKKAYEGV